MADPRYEKLAKVLVDYCLDVQKKDLVLIRAGLPAAPLVREVYREVLEAGGHPITRVALPGATEIFF
ncbi:aminopeptidase, partial [bacterium]|nr:aminopeptidase [bacterium]